MLRFGKKKIIIVLGAAILLLAAVLLLMKNPWQSKAAAREFLTIYYTEAGMQLLPEEPDERGLLLTQKYGEFMTRDALENGVANRILTDVWLAAQETGSTLSCKSVALRREDELSDGEYRFAYTTDCEVFFTDGTTKQTQQIGTISLIKEDGRWRVSRFVPEYGVLKTAMEDPAVGGEETVAPEQTPQVSHKANITPKPREFEPIKDMIIKPDTIIWHHNGVQTEFTPDDEAFDEIFTLNMQRFAEPIGFGDSYECLIMPSEKEYLQEHSDMLDYIYDEEVRIDRGMWGSTHREFVYQFIRFPLAKDPNTPYPADAWLIKKIYSMFWFTHSGPYGYLAPADELMEYLNGLDKGEVETVD